MATPSSMMALSERVGILGISGSVTATPVGLFPTVIVATTVLSAVRMTETVLSF